MAQVQKQGLGIDEIIGDKREDILRLAEKYGATNVRVFGSVARGDATPQSDVDLLVTFRSGASLYDLAGLSRDLTGLLGHSVDVLSDHPRLRDRLRRNILREVVPL